MKPQQCVSAGVLSVCVCMFGNCHIIHWFGETHPLLVVSGFLSKVWASSSAKRCTGAATGWVLPLWEPLPGRAQEKPLPAPWLLAPLTAMVLTQLCAFALWPRLGIGRGWSLLDKLGGCVWVRHDSPC